MPAQLLSLGDGPHILLDKPILLLGRHPECDVQIDSRKISRRHCCIAQISDYLVVRDLGSTNGVRINGVRVVEGKLSPGDELMVGTFRYRVMWDSMVQPAAPAARPPSAPSIAVDDDDLLESCDNPVPLADPIATSKPAPPVAPPARANPEHEDAFILPDHLELLPQSDVFPPPTSPQRPPV